VRAVLDPNVLIAALLSPSGTPATLLVRWFAGEYELVVSEQLLEELGRVLAYPKIRARISEEDAIAFVERLRANTEIASDPPKPTPRSADSGDDYLLALAEAEHALLVSGDKHLLDLANAFPVRTPREFSDALESGR
jgi:putative PIN family toxin of toxin-antitoxin system